MSSQLQTHGPRATAETSASCRGRGGECDRPTQIGDLCAACIYDEKVLEDPTICRRCFRRTHRIELVSTNNRSAAVGGDLDWVVNDGVWKLEGEVYFRKPEATDRKYPPPKDRERSEQRTICICGDVDGAPRETLSREKALEHADRLSARLEELQIDHEPRTLLDVVDDRKHEPETAGRDQPVFREAVATAIEVAV